MDNVDKAVDKLVILMFYICKTKLSLKWHTIVEIVEKAVAMSGDGGSVVIKPVDKGGYRFAASTI